MASDITSPFEPSQVQAHRSLKQLVVNAVGPFTIIVGTVFGGCDCPIRECPLCFVTTWQQWLPIIHLFDDGVHMPIHEKVSVCALDGIGE